MSEQFIPLEGGPRQELAAHRSTDQIRSIHFIDERVEALRFVATSFEHAGYAARLHANFADFVTGFERERAEAVFVDVRPGGDDAIDTLEFLRLQNVACPVFLVANDDKAMDCASRYAAEVGVVIAGTLAKPLAGKHLVELVSRKRTSVGEIVEQIDIREGVEQGWIYPVLQPKLDLASWKIASAEILTRVAHPHHGIIAAHSFIGEISETQAQALFLENLRLSHKCVSCAARDGEPFAININIDPKSLAGVHGAVRKMADEHPDLFQHLVFELTEESISRLSANDLKLLFQLNLAGARFAIDDFGVGHSNFSRIARLPITELKIDRSLVHGCARQPQRQTIIKAIIVMAHDLGIRVVAEGVENYDDIAWLECVRCDEAQGFLIARPMAVERCRDFVRQFNDSGTNGRIRLNA